jgi:hypothetical protein
MGSMQRPFPPQMDAVKPSSVRSRYFLGTQEVHEQLLVTTPKKLFGKAPYLLVHAGPKEDSPELVSIGKESTFTRTNVVNIPSMPNANIEFKTNCGSGGGWKTIIHRFSLDLGPSRGTEDFEWYMTSSAVVTSYGSYGFELRRTTNGAKDVVGVLGLGKWSFHRTFTFALLGDGQAGTFGPVFDLVALITAARTNQMEEERLSTNASSAAAASASAAAAASS